MCEGVTFRRLKTFYSVFTGTGKTATFSISILQSLDTTLRETQVLCLSPTRELAVQIQKVILALGDFMNVQCHAVSLDIVVFFCHLNFFVLQILRNFFRFLNILLVYRWHKFGRRYSQIGLWSTYC